MSIIHASSTIVTIKSGVNAGPVLTLTSLVSNDFDFSASPWSSAVGVRVSTNGDVLERLFDIYVIQNSGVEWIDDGGATASNYEVFVTKTSGTNNIQPSNLDTWLALTVTRTFQDGNVTVEGTYSWIGTMEIREISTPGNTTGVISVIMSVENGMA